MKSDSVSFPCSVFHISEVRTLMKWLCLLSAVLIGCSPLSQPDGAGNQAGGPASAALLGEWEAELRALLHPSRPFGCAQNAGKLGRRHAALIAELTAAIATMPSPEPVHGESPQARTALLLSDFLSGENGIDTAIPILVERIDERLPITTLEDSFILNQHAYALALARMGPVALPHIVDYLWETPRERISDEKIRLYALVLSGMPIVESAPDFSAVKAMLEAISEHARSVNRDDNFVRVLAVMESREFVPPKKGQP